jgi:hypothetical protein
LELIEAAKTGDVDVGLAALVSGTDVRCYDSAGWCVRMSEGGRRVVQARRLTLRGAGLRCTTP